MADPIVAPVAQCAEPDRQDILMMARAAGLVLPPAYESELVLAYGFVRTMVARLPGDRPRSDEPAQVFDPTRFLPAGEA